MTIDLQKIIRQVDNVDEDINRFERQFDVLSEPLIELASIYSESSSLVLKGDLEFAKRRIRNEIKRQAEILIEGLKTLEVYGVNRE